MAMGTQTEVGYAKIENYTKQPTLSKVSLITPGMDVDMTGASIKNVRTHLIDHPKDEGLKQREQLWNFQQKYRGVPAAKLKPVSSTANKGMVVNGIKTNSPCENVFSDEASNDQQSMQRSVSSEGLYLQPPFRRRFSHRLRITVRPGVGDGYTVYDTPKTNINTANVDTAEMDEKQLQTIQQGLQRQYSSGLIVRNSLYNRLLAGDNAADKKQVTLEESRLLRQAINKYGSLERLPNIGCTNQTSEYAQSQMLGNSLRSMNPYVQFGRKIGVQQPDNRITPLRRSVTNIETPRKHLAVSRMDEQNEPSSRLSCIESDDEDGVIDDEEEYVNETRIARTQKLHEREPKRVSFKVNLPTFNTQDDMALLDAHALAKRARQYSNGITESVVMEPDRTARNLSTSARLAQDAIVISDAACYLYSSDDSDMSDSENGKENKAKHKLMRKYSKQANDKKQESDSGESEERPSSTDSLDMPKERFGPTTHSIDRKLAIRKPWDWRPSLYRWTDKTLRETDKPYIEKVINSGELVDEYNYDSFARTKPLKPQNYPQQCQPFKDRNGVLR